MSEQYEKVVTETETMFNDFLTNAKEGKEGKGSKAKALQARKLSVQLSRKLQEFRKTSIENDKLK